MTAIYNLHKIVATTKRDDKSKKMKSVLSHTFDIADFYPTLY